MPVNKIAAACAVVIGFAACASAQHEISGAARIRLAIENLANTGSALMIAAHPDDENTALLAYLARGRHLRTGYLSVTRGEGGQNLIGSQLGATLGLIRTQELLEARKIDGAEQFFTRAIDFGYSKTAAESLEKWGHERTLGDVVWVIRRFRPDVIISRWSGTPRDGHGQHQAAGMLAKEAYEAAADPKRYPEQLKYVQAWRAKRLMWNMFSWNRRAQKEDEHTPGRIEVDLGAYDPVLGYSYAEIAGMSRSMHRSQGMGAAQRKGSQPNYLITTAGERATRDPFDGVDLTWSRVPGGAAIGSLLNKALGALDPAHPEKAVPVLAQARALMVEMSHLAEPGRSLVQRKLKRLNEAILLAAGVSADVTVDHYAVVPGNSLKLTTTVINRGPLQVREGDKLLPSNEPVSNSAELAIPANAPYSQPYWLCEPPDGDSYRVSDPLLIGLPENPPRFTRTIAISVAGQNVNITRNATFRYIDHVLGERMRPVVVEPPVAVDMPARAAVFPNAAAKHIEMTLAGNASVRGTVRLAAPAGWRVEPASIAFHIDAPGQRETVPFTVTPPAGDSRGELRAVADIPGSTPVEVGQVMIDFPHIEPQALFAPSQTEVVRADIRMDAKRIGYVMGAGDEEPDALRQIGADVTLLSADDLSRGDLSRFDAVVTGVRAYNTRADLRANEQRLLDYVQNGGTLVVQYNVLDGDPSLLAHIGPYPMKITHDRVSVETVPVAFPHPDSALLKEPNKITERDFDGWVQERGLYFASEWDPRYTPLFEMHDPNEPARLGSTLVTRYGKGMYVFTALSWFRQLPAGVPGAYRVFANFVSGGK